MVHVAGEPGDSHQRDVSGDEVNEANQHDQVDGARSLAAAEDAHVAGKAVDERRRHGHTGKDRERSHDEDRGKVDELLESVVAVKSVGLRRQMEVSVIDEGVPRVYEDSPGWGMRRAHW